MTLPNRPITDRFIAVSMHFMAALKKYIFYLATPLPTTRGSLSTTIYVYIYIYIYIVLLYHTLSTTGLRHIRGMLCRADCC